MQTTTHRPTLPARAHPTPPHTTTHAPRDHPRPHPHPPRGLLTLIDATDTANATGATRICAGVLAAQGDLIRHAALIGQETDPVTKVDQKHRALARRITKRTDDYLRFATDLAVPFSNNAAEQTIRMAKIRVKVSGCMRTLAGAKEFASIRSYTATATKHGLTMLDALTRLTSGNTWYPATT